MSGANDTYTTILLTAAACRAVQLSIEIIHSYIMRWRIDREIQKYYDAGGDGPAFDDFDDKLGIKADAKRVREEVR